jgi:septal ring factor EnvC (AmiA/AmiB activator)
MRAPAAGGLLLIMCGCSVAWAGQDAEKSQALVNVQNKIQQLGADVRTLAAEKTRQLEQLKKIEKQLGDLNNALLEIKQQVVQLEQALKIVRSKIAVTEKAIHTQQHGLEGLIKSAYAIGGKEAEKVILNPRDPSISSRMLVYHSYLSKARLEKIQRIQDDFKTLQALETEKARDARLLRQALDKKQHETESVQALKLQRESLVAKLDGNQASKQEALVRLQQDEKKLSALVVSLQQTDDNDQKPLSEMPTQPVSVPPRPIENVAESPPKASPKPVIATTYAAFAELQGQLPWPAQGAISERFGSKRFETTWDGTIISAREGAAVQAIAAGRVVYADWLRGYGLMLIIDHGKGFMSLYGFAQSLQKSVGDAVNPGDMLATVGRSGGRSQAALYFGIRKKGLPVDPAKWCRKPASG